MPERFCEFSGKRRFGGKGDALADARNRAARGHAVVRLSAYRCERCGDWHLTSNEGIDAKRRRRTNGRPSA